MRKAGFLLIASGVAMIAPLAFFALPGLLGKTPQPVVIGADDYWIVIAVPAAALLGALVLLLGLVLSAWPRKRTS